MADEKASDYLRAQHPGDYDYVRSGNGAVTMVRKSNPDYSGFRNSYKDVDDPNGVIKRAAASKAVDQAIYSKKNIGK